MAATTRRLLAVLISNHGNPVERDCLLKKVWDDNGMRSSNSNLNQYISILRKQLLQVGLPDNAVITIPRVGFMFSPDIEVRRDIPVTAMQLSRTGKKLRYFTSGILYYPMYTICVFLLCLSVFFIFFVTRG
ncbi:winged helix-turn-helix domain-containing protein [Salmonella enterica]|nr:winged helix-turn-helix domain-containing protein [Salmonella enterica]EKB7612266.1 winged helix-turn-helix domain-containing protein [Salmonella enterica]